MEIGAFSISLAHTGSMPQRTAASGNTPIPSNRLPSRSAVILSAPLSLDGQNALKGGSGDPEPLGNGDVVLHGLGDSMTAHYQHMRAAEQVAPHVDTALMLPKQEMLLSIEEKNVMSVMIPKYSVEYKLSDPNSIYSYGFADTPGDMDSAILSLSEILPKLIRLAEVEKSCQLMAAEIEKTRRRVNALEYIMIPGYEETIRYITMKLDENERSTITRLMKVKDMMIKENIEEKQSK